MSKDGGLTQTKYHGAFFYNARLHAIMASLDEITSTRSSNAAQALEMSRQQYNYLQAFFKELSNKMPKETLKDHLQASNFIYSEIEKSAKDYARTGKLNTRFINLMDAWEIELRQFMEIKGLVSPEKLDFGAATGLEDED